MASLKRRRKCTGEFIIYRDISGYIGVYHGSSVQVLFELDYHKSGSTTGHIGCVGEPGEVIIAIFNIIVVVASTAIAKMAFPSKSSSAFTKS